MKNWRTTLLGCIAALATYLSTVDWNNPIDWKTLVAPAAFAVWGYLQKDAGVTGIEK